MISNRTLKEAIKLGYHPALRISADKILLFVNGKPCTDIQCSMKEYFPALNFLDDEHKDIKDCRLC